MERRWADHLIKRDIEGAPEYDPEDVLLDGARNALVVSDNCTSLLGFYPQGTTSKEETTRSFRHDQGYNVIQLLYCDNAGELVESAIDMDWNVDTSTPGEPTSNGVIERIVGRIKEGIRTNLRHSGFHPKWWPYAGKNFSHSRGT